MDSFTDLSSIRSELRPDPQTPDPDRAGPKRPATPTRKDTGGRYPYYALLAAAVIFVWWVLL